MEGLALFTYFSELNSKTNRLIRRIRAEILREGVYSEKVSFQLESHLFGPKSRLLVHNSFGNWPPRPEILKMRPKTRGLAQHGCPPGRLEESDPGGCDFVRDGQSMPPTQPRSGAAQLRASGNSAAVVLLINVHKQQT